MSGRHPYDPPGPPPFEGACWTGCNWTTAAGAAWLDEQLAAIVARLPSAEEMARRTAAFYAAEDARAARNAKRKRSTSTGNLFGEV